MFGIDHLGVTHLRQSADAPPTTNLIDVTRSGLRYVSDSEPGIHRRRAGRGFFYLAPDGSRITDIATLKRIRALAVPPAWTDVWISADPNGHIQATGRDAKARKQYRYHPDWHVVRDDVKFSSLAAFAEALPCLRRHVEHDLKRPGICRDRVLASVVWLLDRTLIRIGNESYRKENASFGLTTLRSNHVTVEGSRLRFCFTGKSGRKWNLRLMDRRISRIVAEIDELPGQHLFQYLDEDLGQRPLRSHDVNAYIQDAAGPEFSSKHFRTWGATTRAAVMLAGVVPPASKCGRTRHLTAVIDTIAARLRNTRAVCRSGYIHPDVIETWKTGRLTSEITDLRRRYRRPLSGLDRDESTVLRWLRNKT